MPLIGQATAATLGGKELSETSSHSTRARGGQPVSFVILAATTTATRPCSNTSCNALYHSHSNPFTQIYTGLPGEVGGRRPRTSGDERVSTRRPRKANMPISGIPFGAALLLLSPALLLQWHTATAQVRRRGQISYEVKPIDINPPRSHARPPIHPNLRWPVRPAPALSPRRCTWGLPTPRI